MRKQMDGAWGEKCAWLQAGKGLLPPRESGGQLSEVSWLCESSRNRLESIWGAIRYNPKQGSAIVYISSVVKPLSDADLEALLAQSREKNGRLKVTGILLYKDGDIMQLIEGPREAVRNLATTIYADRRHQGIIQLLERKVIAREFPNWSMEFHELSLAKVEHLAKFLGDEKSLTQGGRLSPTLRLLTSFGWRPNGGN